MGSLNLDGSIKSRQNTTYRNIGGSITSTEQELPNARATIVVGPSVPFASGATNANLVTSQYASLGYSRSNKTTYAVDDSIINRNTGVVNVTSSNQQEVANIPVRDYGFRHTGGRISTGDSSEDSVVERNRLEEDMRIPSSPLSVVGTVNGSNIIVTWVAPEDLGTGTLIGYKVERKEFSDNIWTTLTQNTLSTDVSFVDATNLTERDYLYRVAAINSYNIGSYGLTPATVRRSQGGGGL